MSQGKLLKRKSIRFLLVGGVMMVSVAAAGGRMAAVAAVAACVAVAYLIRGALFRLVLWLTGRAQGVPLRGAWGQSGQERRMSREVERLRSKSRMVERDPAGFEKWETPMGPFWIPSRKIAGEALLEMLAEESLEIYGDGETGVEQGAVVLDCGANVGTFVRAALESRASRVVASEPSEENLECLRRNCAEALARGQVVLVAKGVWHEETTIRLYVSDSPAGDSFVVSDRKAEGPELQVTTIDRIVEEQGLERLDFIKFDIEGAERNALRGALATLRKLRPKLAVSAYHLKDDPEVLTGIVEGSGAGYERRVIGARLMSPGLLNSYMLPIVLLFRPK